MPSAAAEMLELHRYRHVDWTPSPVVALAASVDSSVVAAGRGNGSIEIWVVSPGSVGWHCERRIPGKKEASLSCLLWCPSSSSSRGRLFSGGLDGFISEWDLLTLQPKEVVNSYGGSVWQMAVEPQALFQRPKENGVNISDHSSSLSSDSDSDNDDNEASDSDNEDTYIREQRVAVACDDGCLRLFTVKDNENMIYKRTFPKIEGRILSVAWSLNAEKIFSGSSDGCIRCWDTRLFRELFRITSGLGGIGNGSNLCIWSLLTLKDGTVVSGDSSGSTQFWDGKQGTHLQALTTHKADVLALAASPDHKSIYAAGADGQVVQYALVPESKVLAEAARNSKVDVGVGLGEKWVYIGSKRTHSHDVNAVVVASPIVSEPTNNAEAIKSPRKRRKKEKKSWIHYKEFKVDGARIPMLISGGNDAKLFTYPANAFLAFHPHDVCTAPQCPPITIAANAKYRNGQIVMAQHEHQIDIWKIVMDQGSSRLETSDLNSFKLDSALGKRKSEEFPHQNGRQKTANGHTKVTGFANGGSTKKYLPTNDFKHLGITKGKSPELLARIKCKSIYNITCSAISDSGQLVAFSDPTRPRLFKLEQQSRDDFSGKEIWGIKKRELPSNLPPAHSMVFSGSNLLLACPDSSVWVVDSESCTVLHCFEAERDGKIQNYEDGLSPITSMCASSDGQWLATVNASGDIRVCNLETFRHHWHVPPLDGTCVTVARFHPANSSILIAITNANVLYVLDVEEKRLGEWSRQNGSRLPQSFLEFPGGIKGLSFSPTEKTSIVAYSSKAMCFIDFKKPVPQDGVPTMKSEQKAVHANGAQTKKLQNGGLHKMDKNFVIVPFKDPVLYVGFTAGRSILVIEKPWLDAVNQLPPPVYRHLYGT